MTDLPSTSVRNPAARRGETPLFTRLFDLLAWLTPCVEKFPRGHRFTLGAPLLNSGYACHAALIRARKVTGVRREEAQLDGDVHLETLRLQWRVALELHCISMGQFEHGARLMDEVGRLLGAWRRAL